MTSDASTDRSREWILAIALTVLVAAPAAAADKTPLGFEQLAAIRNVAEAELSPDGKLIAYTLNVPRTPGEDDDGPAWRELHVVPVDGGAPRAFVRGQVNVSQIAFTPDGNAITYVAKRGDDKESALWSIPVAGGESTKIAEFATGIGGYEISPDGRQVAFVARPERSKARKDARDKGYTEEVFEEDWRPRQVWIATLDDPNAPMPNPAAAANNGDEDDDNSEPRTLDLPGSAFELTWSPDGSKLAVTVAPTPLIDDRYMARRIHVVDPESAQVHGVIETGGKLGAFRFSPDGKQVAMISAADPNDPSAGRLMVAPITGGTPTDKLPEFPGQVNRFAWQDERTLVYLADLGTETELGEVNVDSGLVKSHQASGRGRPVLTGMSLSDDGKQGAFIGETPNHPAEVYTMRIGDEGARRLTNSNPWLDEVALGRQETIRHEARDGLELEGVLIHPVKERDGAAPLVLIVHGGPESHVRNGWVTNYSRPGQLMAGEDYAVFYPNYRGSTGRGVAFSKLSQGDAAGKEFDDLVDAVDHLVAEGIADTDRVGITGGSYGGYATAWASTRFTERFKAGVMFVGISNKVSKGLTTEIPVEDKMVHTLFDPWTKWQFSLERSPVYYAQQSRTALLIAGGSADSRVHPSQSLQLYRALKLIGKAPVRYVIYPGEGHGNRRAASRDDYSRRTVRWMNWFVKDGKTELPPWDLGHGQDAEDEAKGG